MERTRIKLQGKSLKGKNRVRELGSTWAIISEPRPCQCFNGDLGITIVPLDSDRLDRHGFDRARWVRVQNDPDFSWTNAS